MAGLADLLEAYRNYSKTQDWMLGRQMDVMHPQMEQAMSIFGGMGPSNMGGLVGMFAGAGSKTANQAMLTKARAMDKMGKHQEDIWKTTGWFRAPWDQQWRYEIPDDIAQFKTVFSNKEVPLQQSLEHKDLFQAYPAIAEKTYFNYVDPRVISGFNAAYTKNTFDDPLVLLSKKQGLGSQGISSILHELQHGIQDYERFSSGGTSSGVAEYAKAMNMDPYDVYNALAGEAEARLVQKRHLYTPEQRRAIYPLSDMDLPIDQLISARK